MCMMVKSYAYGAMPKRKSRQSETRTMRMNNRERRDCDWDNDVSLYLDDDDLLHNATGAARRIFASVPPSTRPSVETAQLGGASYGMDVPLTAFVEMFMAAWKKRGYAIMTSRQKQAWELYEEAQELGIPYGRYVAESLNISVSNAYVLLNRTRTKLTVRFAPNRAKLRQIARIRRSLTRKCAICYSDTPAHDKALCWRCHDRFERHEDYGRYTPDEIRGYIKQANSEFNERVEAEYNRRHGLT